MWTPLEDKPHSAPHCDFPLAASTSFELPRSSDLLYFGAGGSLINTFGHNGIITFTNNPNTSVSPDTIQVDIVASYSSESSFRGVEVCTIKRNGKRNTTGVNFFVSEVPVATCS